MRFEELQKILEYYGYQKKKKTICVPSGNVFHFGRFLANAYICMICVFLLDLLLTFSVDDRIISLYPAEEFQKAG